MTPLFSFIDLLLLCFNCSC